MLIDLQAGVSTVQRQGALCPGAPPPPPDSLNNMDASVCRASMVLLWGPIRAAVHVWLEWFLSWTEHFSTTSKYFPWFFLAENRMITTLPAHTQVAVISSFVGFTQLKWSNLCLEMNRRLFFKSLYSGHLWPGHLCTPLCDQE